jgi:hypothetical protein
VWDRLNQPESEGEMDLKMLAEIPPWDWPPDAGEALRGVLQDRRADEGDRLVAADLAGDVAVLDDDLAEALLSVVDAEQEPEELRARAAISLGPALEQAEMDGFDDPEDLILQRETFDRIQQTLQRLHGDDGVARHVRRHVLEASVRAPQAWHREAIAAAFSSPDESWKRTAVFCMRFVPGFDDAIVESLDSEDVATQAQAVFAAGAWGVEAAWPRIAALIDSEEIDQDLLIAAIEAVAVLRPREAVELLADFTESENEEIAETALEALATADALSATE